jgi:NADPH-dependent curcumin reductase CurA
VTASRNRQILLAARPVGLPKPGDFHIGMLQGRNFGKQLVRLA